MKAAILIAQHQPLVIDDVELPPELSIGQVLVRVCYSSICGSQIGEILGVKGADPYLPHLLGHEGSGCGGSDWSGCFDGVPRGPCGYGCKGRGWHQVQCAPI